MKLVMGLSLMSFLATVPAFAGVTAGAGLWTGNGTAFGADGKEQSNFTMKMTNTPNGQHTVDTEIAVSLADGTEKKIRQTMTDSDQGFSLHSDLGDGGGYCLGDGICLAYVSSGNGHAYSMTIVIDDSTHKRIILTELQNGKAVRFLREKFVKVN